MKNNISNHLHRVLEAQNRLIVYAFDSFYSKIITCNMVYANNFFNFKVSKLFKNFQNTKVSNFYSNNLLITIRCKYMWMLKIILNSQIKENTEQSTRTTLQKLISMRSYNIFTEFSLLSAKVYQQFFLLNFALK